MPRARASIRSSAPRSAVTVKRGTFKHDPLGSSEQIFGEK
jgi:hypothetical protein